MAQHNSSQALQQHQQQQHSNNQQQPQQTSVVVPAPAPQHIVAASQNNNITTTATTAAYPPHSHHYPMPGNVFVPTAAGPHGGTIYSVMPATLPGNVFVNNVTANVNLHGAWTAHPTAYIPAGQTYIPANPGEITQNVTAMEQVLQPTIVSQSNNNTIPRNNNRRSRNNSNPRQNNINRRNDYNQRNHITSPGPQDIVNANGIDPNNPTGAALAQGFPHAYGYPQFAAAACPQPPFFNHIPPQQVSHSQQAQQATGAPLYLAPMYAPGPPIFNYPFLISHAPPHAHMLPAAATSQGAAPTQEYQISDERNPDGVTAIDQHGQPIHIQQMQPQLWNPHEIPIEYQEQYLVGNPGGIPNEDVGEDINHNTAVSITDSDTTPSLMSPTGYPVHYDQNMQIMDAQQHMSSLQIYDQQGISAEEEIHQQHVIHEQQQADQHYGGPRIHDQVVMISHEVNVYNSEQEVCERTEIIHEMHSPHHSHQIEQQNVYHSNEFQHHEEQQQTIEATHQEHYPQSNQFHAETQQPPVIEEPQFEITKSIESDKEFNQKVPNNELENCLHNTEIMTNNTNVNMSVHQSTNTEPPLANIIPEKNNIQFIPSPQQHFSPSESVENIKPLPVVVPVVAQPINQNIFVAAQQQNHTIHQAPPVVLPSYQPSHPVIQPQQTQPILPVIEVPVNQNQNSPPNINKTIPQYVPNQVAAVPVAAPVIITTPAVTTSKKTTASVAVTATPIQQQITTQVDLQTNNIQPNVATKVIEPTNQQAQIINQTSPIQTVTASPPQQQVKQQQVKHQQMQQQQHQQSSSNLPQRERKVQQVNVQVEQKSIASTAVPHQIQENNQISIRSNGTDSNKSGVVISEEPKSQRQHKSLEKKDSEAKTAVNQKTETETKTQSISTNQSIPTAITTNTNQSQQSTISAPPPQMSWASLFAKPQPTNISSMNAANTNTFGNTTANHTQTVNKKPIAKVLPFENTATPQPIIVPGALSYSAQAAASQKSTVTTTTVTTSHINSNGTHSSGNQQNGPVTKINKILSNHQMMSPSGDNVDEWTIKYADFLKKYKTDFSPISLKPRGLKNPNNYCFINAVLQALIGCSPLYNLLKSAPKQSAALHMDKSKIPTINAMTQLIADYNTLPFGVRLINRRDRTQKQNQKQLNNDEMVGELQTDSAFEALSIYKLWNSSRPDVDEGRQGDAEEFLSYVLNKLNDEMLEIIKLMSKPAPILPKTPVQQNGNAFGDTDEGGDDDWQMIYNNKNKGSVTRQTDFGKTPISDIFRGELRSRLQREGEHSTDVIQPFYTLQLNIEKAGSVREALEILVGRDQLEGVTCSKTNQEVVAWQQMTLEKLPLILIVHLKFFDYKSDGCTKIVKQFEFPLELKIDTKILASKKYSAKQKLYRLFAVVYHDGKEAIKGHYISDVYHSGYSSWLRYDDANVKPISENSVLRPRGLRVPYLLFYRRCDTLPAVATTTQSSTSITSSSSTSSMNSSQQQQPTQQHYGSIHSKFNILARKNKILC